MPADSRDYERRAVPRVAHGSAARVPGARRHRARRALRCDRVGGVAARGNNASLHSVSWGGGSAAPKSTLRTCREAKSRVNHKAVVPIIDFAFSTDKMMVWPKIMDNIIFLKVYGQIANYTRIYCLLYSKKLCNFQISINFWFLTNIPYFLIQFPPLNSFLP